MDPNLPLTEFLRATYEEGIRIWIHQGDLHYRCASGALTREQIATLRQHKAEIVSFLGKTRQLVADEQSLEAHSRHEVAPLTMQQCAVWDASKYDMHNYCISAIRLSGGLEVEALCRSVREVIRRHDSLRTTFVVIDGTPLQHIDESRVCDFLSTSIDDRSTSDVGRAAQKIVREFFERPTDLRIDKLTRVILLRLSEQDHILAVGTHEIISDELSLHILLRDLYISYKSQIIRQPPLPPPSCQYPDYVTWQLAAGRKWQDANRASSGAVAPECIVPWDMNELDSRSLSSAAELGFSLTESVSRGLCDLARREKSDLAVVMLSVFAIAVSNWCDHAEFSIPFVFHGRQRAEHTNVVGRFAYGISLKVELSGNSTFVEVLRNIARQLLQARVTDAFGEAPSAPVNLPFGPAFNWLMFSHGMNGAIPLLPEWGDDIPSLVASPFPVTTEMPVWGNTILLRLWKAPNSLSGNIKYPAGRLSIQGVRRLCRELQSASEYVVCYPLDQLASFQSFIAESRG